MIKRIIEISQARTHLSIKYSQLVIKEAGAQVASIPCEDIGVLLVDHRGTTYTHSVFTELLKCGAAIVLCGQNHHPTGMLLPLESNTLQTEHFRRQAEAKEPVKKRLWKQNGIHPRKLWSGAPVNLSASGCTWMTVRK